ncbi:tyrosine-protein phosphatase [Streptomyces sp. NPDC059639]|uniref:tyrosine-protein phosphatase n=1 Tax=Streptomyces sp. NPDC059639 TaxID=3346891 RepID=UPI0036A62B7A
MTRHIAFAHLHNFRDLGGYRTLDGRTVRWGRLYRSDALSKLSPALDDATAERADWERYTGLGIRTVIDLRYPREIAASGRVPEIPGQSWVNLSVEHRPYDQTVIDPAVDPWRHLADRYLEVAHDGADELRQALDLIASTDEPLVFHCASGKDRTGLLAALVLTLLGVHEDDVAADFALTELARDRLLADWKAAHEGREPGWPGFGRAPETIMRLFLADLSAQFGSVQGYVTEHLGMDEELTTRLRKGLLS